MAADETTRADLEEALDILDRLLDWALANRDTDSEFVRCYTYRTGHIPPAIRQAKRLVGALKRKP